VTEEYLTRINAMEGLPVGETAQFIALAATLLLIKSRSLLPSLALTEDESHDIKELEYRLAVFQIIKEAARGLGRALWAPALYEGRSPELPPLYAPDPGVTPEALRGAAHALIDGFPQTLELPKVSVKKVVSLEEMIERLRQRVAAAMTLSFKEFAGGRGGKQPPKHDVIIGFLALLELVKQGIINATQEEGGDIRLEQDAPATPSWH
jgi:segregation and condensation protein A